MDEVEKRKDFILKYLKANKNKVVYLLLAIIAYIGYSIRIRNLWLIKEFIPDLDSYAFLRYAEYIVEHGKLMALDTLRYHPFGFDPGPEFGFLSYTLAYLYKIMHAFNPSIRVIDAAIYYPPITFLIAIVIFFLFVKKLFNYKIALLSTAFLSVIPIFLYRTIAGVSDKEPLGILFIFATLYVWACIIKEQSAKKALIFGFAAGILTFLASLAWGGVSFLFLTIGTFALIEIFLNRFGKKDVYAYSIWTLASLIPLITFIHDRFSIATLFGSLTTMVMLLAFFLGVINYVLFELDLFKIKEKVKHRLPYGLASLLVVAVLGIIFLTIMYGPAFFIHKIKDLFINLTEPFGTTRWALTVAESHQPYFTSWIGEVGPLTLILAFAGVVLLFYEIVKPLGKKISWETSALFALMILGIALNRYSAESTFNGETLISHIFYLGSIILLASCLIYGYIKMFYHNKEELSKIKNFEKSNLLAIIFIIFMTIAARSAIRLFFVFAPAVTIAASYFIIQLFEMSQKLKEKAYKICAIAILILIVLSPLGLLGLSPALNGIFVQYAESSFAQAKYVGPSYDPQWQNAMKWVRENTPKEAIFAHWWDYGYWVQWGGRRATLSDGGNARGAINHFIGRHVLTAHNETEALQLLRANNATHLLIISDEIGKYPAFSSIGADENYDRYSWVPTFTLNPQMTQETRNETLYVYQLGTALDHDFIYNSMIFPANSAGIAAIIIPFINIEEAYQKWNTDKNFSHITGAIKQPTAVMVYGGQQYRVPVECLFLEGKEMTFETKGLPACLRMIPTIDPQTGAMQPLSAGLYLSPEVKQTLFTQIYLFGQNTEHLKMVYTDENLGAPLALYGGRLIGPLKIWQISYPDNLIIPPEYYGQELLDTRVEQVSK